ncbi:MAG: branched-chain amino acid ABC transporter substrate-binding protein [Anaerolineae bacterium]|nr:branched-chain amino acid ABC transporter substrate-binding protein [Anaerolineae bacterium]
MKRTQWLVLLTALLMLAVTVACGGGQTAAPAAAPTTAPAAAKPTEAPAKAAATAAPAPTQAPAAAKPTEAAAKAGPSATIKIVSSLPMTGSSLGQTQTVVNAIKQALDEAQSKACNGAVTITFEAWDDATAARGAWDPDQETQNANKAAADKSIVAYIGTFNSGAAKLSIPILNQAGPLVMISPANTYPGLTKPGKGEAGEPDKYYPTKVRNYTRVVPADDLQGAVGASWAKQLGATKVYILDDQELYGKGLADVFEASAKKIGLQVLGRDGIDGKAQDYRALMTKIKGLNPDLIYYGGITQNNAGQLVKDMRAAGMAAATTKFMGPDGIFEQAFIDAAGKDAAEGVYVTFGGIPPAKLEGDAKKWYDAYKAKFNAEPEAYAVYGYEAAKVVLAAINKSCANPTDRKAIRDAVFATKDYKGVLGTWSFDENGDTTLTDMSGSQVKAGKFEFVSTLKSQ